MASALTDSEKQQIAALHAQGDSCNAIATAIGRATSTVSTYCKSVGLSFSTTQTAAAVKSHKDRAAALRAQLEEDLLNDVLWIRKQRTMVTDARSLKDLMAAASYAVNASLKIHAADSDQGDDSADVDAWIKGMTGGGK